MPDIKNLIFFLFTTAFLGFISCQEVTIEEPVDLDEQRETDINLIEEYLLENEITDYGVTPSGARYYVEEQGSGDPIQRNDILKLDYLAKTLEGTVVFTNIPAVADTSIAVSTGSLLEPRVVTFTESGWSFNFVSFLEGTQLLNGDGMNEAVGRGLSMMNVGGKLIVLLPSDQALGAQTTTFIDPFSVLVYEVYPIEKL